MIVLSVTYSQTSGASSGLPDCSNPPMRGDAPLYSSGSLPIQKFLRVGIHREERNTHRPNPVGYRIGIGALGGGGDPRCSVAARVFVDDFGLLDGGRPDLNEIFLDRIFEKGRVVEYLASGRVHPHAVKGRAWLGQAAVITG